MGTAAGGNEVSEERDNFDDLDEVPNHKTQIGQEWAREIGRVANRPSG